MTISRNIKYWFSVFLLLLVVTEVRAQKAVVNRYDFPVINCIDVKLPVTLSWVDFDYPPEVVPPMAEEEIKKIIIDFFLESNGGDSADMSKAKDGYFGTLRMPFNNLVLFVVVLKTPLSYSHCKLFLYDSVQKAVSKSAIDYNTWAMYSIEDNSMKRADLFKSFHLDSDDIILVEKKQSSMLLLKRLKHNGTYNELEEITYRANGLSLDTVSAKSKILD
jgi:hypothetical protein